MSVQKITFVDSGQDFTDFYIREGIVIDCQPAQGMVWVGTKVVGEVAVGKFIEIESRFTGRNTFLKHYVESVETLAEVEAVETTQVAHKWAQKLSLEPSALGL